jgi:nicotinamide-nucleotide amidase
MRTGEIMAIGSELLEGRPETNSLFLTAQLEVLGVDVRFKSVVGDDEKDIARALDVARRRADVVILTGGLGPTTDDCTRQAVAHATGKLLRRNAGALADMTRRLAAWGRKPSPAQLRQALIPAGAAVLRNPVGSAPGFMLSWRRCLIAALPGVPAEARQMFAAAVAPRIRALAPARAPRARIERRLLHTFGLGEAEVDERLKDCVDGRAVRLGLRASPLGVTVALSSNSSVTSSRALAQAVRQAKQRLGRSIYAEGEGTMEQVVGRQLTARRLTLALAESCTGGLIGHRLTQVPGSSAYLERAAVCYSNRAKREWLGVPARVIQRVGAVSAETAEAMARGIRRKSRTAIGLSVTGIAGPGGGTPKKPVGLVYAGLNVRSGRGREVSQVKEFRFYGTRDMIKLRASQAALDLLRQWLEGGRSAKRP